MIKLKNTQAKTPLAFSINLTRYIYIILILFLVWLAVSAVLIYRIEKLGAFASAGVGARKTLRYVEKYAHADPAAGRLNKSYSQWALELNGTDASNYLKAGLGFAEGHGINLKEISPEHPDNNTYIPYYYQAAGPPILIGTMIKLFGEKQILPYFLLMLIAHFITALSTCFIASRFIKEKAFILSAGLLSLLYPTALSFNFGLGIFCGETFAALFIGIAFICLCLFWEKLEDKPIPYKKISFIAFGFGISLALAAYFRDIYTTFAQFCLLTLIVYALFKKSKFKQILTFVLISGIIFSAIEYPWEKRNQKLFGEFTMTGSTYCGYALWYFTWSDYKESSKWASKSAHGLGNFLAPEKSAEVLAKLEQNKKTGSVYAMQCLAQAIMAKPWDALFFKLNAYPTLWIGSSNKRWYIYTWCLLSIIAYFVFLRLTRLRFIPALWLFPLFLLLISPFIHYEHRYSQPFFLFCTPVAAMYVLQYFIQRFMINRISNVTATKSASSSQKL